MSELSICKVSTEADLQAFLRMPWTVYKDDPNWVPPFWRDHCHFFDSEHNPELKHIDMEKFVAWRGDTPVGTVIAFINHAYNKAQNRNAGWFGQFELLDDEEAGHALLQTAEDWVREKGADQLMGPATFSTNSEIGLLIDGFDTPPMILMRHDRPYYQGFIEGKGGYDTGMDLWAWYFDGDDWGGKKADKLPEKLTRVVGKIKTRRNFTLRNPNMRDLKTETEHLKKIYNASWSDNWGFIPLTDAEFDNLINEVKGFLDPNVAFFVEKEGEHIAFGAPLPNIYEPLRYVQSKPGEPHWWQLLRFVWHWKIARRMTSIRAWALGVLPEHRASGADALLYYEMIKAALPRGYKDIEMSWILANNDKMNRPIQMLGARIYKTYRVYEKKL